MHFLKKFKLNRKLDKSRQVILKALLDFGPGNTALAWTGGKDSTLILWITREVCISNNLDLPKIVFIDEGDIFPEIIKFTKEISTNWNFKFATVKNLDVVKHAKKLGQTVKVNTLNPRNQLEIKRLGFDKKEFKFEPESFVGNHLMKTVPMNIYIEKNDIKALITGIRKDENPARSQEQYFSKRQNPLHTRIHPILDFNETDVWDTILSFEIPYVSLYEEGYRSLGAKSTTHKAGPAPAWKQDMKNIAERAGRQQDKEQIMEKLRKLGYM